MQFKEKTAKLTVFFAVTVEKKKMKAFGPKKNYSNLLGNSCLNLTRLLLFSFISKNTQLADTRLQQKGPTYQILSDFEVTFCIPSFLPSSLPSSR